MGGVLPQNPSVSSPPAQNPFQAVCRLGTTATIYGGVAYLRCFGEQDRRRARVVLLELTLYLVYHYAMVVVIGAVCCEMLPVKCQKRYGFCPQYGCH